MLSALGRSTAFLESSQDPCIEYEEAGLGIDSDLPLSFKAYLSHDPDELRKITSPEELWEEVDYDTY
jgi:hypothetical protein